MHNENQQTVYSAWTNFFFSMKNSFVFVEETPTLMQILLTVYNEKPVRET